ncbi:MAG: glycosyltransferase [Rhodospirillaceae bacterium]|nr:glycosyltransferase [Rhodospirillaceae bacterium]
MTGGAASVARLLIQDLPDRTCLRIDGRQSSASILVGFLRHAARALGDDPMLLGHSIHWESREICRVLVALGFDVDVIDIGSPPPATERPYAASLTLHDHLLKVGPVLAPNAVKMMWMTGSHPAFQNSAEMERIQRLEERRGCVYEPKRQIANVPGELAAIELADRCLLVGNATTLSTYPAGWHRKMELIAVSAAGVHAPKDPTGFVPPSREFVWYSSSGAVLKGLDLVLDVFAARRFPTLHVIGSVEREEDFLNIYHAELDGHPRIRRHGFLRGDDPRLAEVFGRSVAVLHPSASEGMSGSVAHCLQIGLYPIISRTSGIDLPEGAGAYLDACTAPAIEGAVEKVLAMPTPVLAEEIGRIQRVALERHARPSFTSRLLDVFGRWLAHLPR